MGAADEPDTEQSKEREGGGERAVTAVANRAGAAGAERKWIDLISKNWWILVPLLLPVAIVVGLIQGAGAAILVLVGAALIAVIALFWSSVRTLLGETQLSGADAYALAAPRAEEEQKQALLRALKDLEFERSVGKISDEDYAALVARYRAEAKRLLRVLDDEAKPRRDRVESLVQERLVAAGIELAPAAAKAPPSPFSKEELKKGKKKKKAGKTGEAAAAAGEAVSGVVEAPAGRHVGITPLDEEAAEKKPAAQTDVTQRSEGPSRTMESAVYLPTTKKCSECRTKNDPDAVFCKKCGSKSFETSDGAKARSEVAVSEVAASNAAVSADEGEDEGDEAKGEEASR